MRHGTNLSRVGGFNQTVVLDAIRRSPRGVSRGEVADSTGLTPQTVSNIVSRLLDDGLVREAGTVAGVRGKPRRVLELQASGRYAVGVHLDPARISIVLLDLLGGLVVGRQADVVEPEHPQHVLSMIRREVLRLVAASGVERSRVLGVGLAVPGPLDESAGMMTEPPQLQGWLRVPVVSELSEALGLPVRLEKDVAAAALAEQWIHHDALGDDFVFVYLGSGVGAGAVLGGSAARGSSGNFGTIGSVLVEAFGGVHRLYEVTQPWQVLERAVVSGLVPPKLDRSSPAAVRRAYEQLAAAAGHDQRVAGLLRESGRALGAAVCQVVDLLDLDSVVLGGSAVSAAAALLLPEVRAAVAGGSQVSRLHPVRVEATALGGTVAAQGAACSVLQSALTPGVAALALPGADGMAPILPACSAIDLTVSVLRTGPVDS